MIEKVQHRCTKLVITLADLPYEDRQMETSRFVFLIAIVEDNVLI